ncbi:MAG: hypothetical protein JOS17DRAFT_793526 [Linnemannia elongata]|nr:MAG: hypothetical protein JOS17DRAFT_793526 [Linnemannia elongata]
MMVGHDLASYAQSLPQPPLSPPPMLPKETSSSSSGPHLHSYHRHIPHHHQQQHSRPVLFHSSSSTHQRASSPSRGLRTDYPGFSTAFSSPSLSSSSLSSSSASPSSSSTFNNNNSAANLPSSSTLSSILRLPPPRPSSAMSTRLPVRLGLGDPRLQSYMISAKPTPSSSSSATTATTSSSSFGRQDRIPAVGVTAPGGSYPSETVRSGISSSSSNSPHRAIPPFHPPSSSPSTSAATLLARPAPDQSPSRTYPESPSMRQASISHSKQWTVERQHGYCSWKSTLYVARIAA